MMSPIRDGRNRPGSARRSAGVMTSCRLSCPGVPPKRSESDGETARGTRWPGGRSGSAICMIVNEPPAARVDSAWRTDRHDRRVHPRQVSRRRPGRSWGGIASGSPPGGAARTVDTAQIQGRVVGPQSVLALHPQCRTRRLDLGGGSARCPSTVTARGSPRSGTDSGTNCSSYVLIQRGRCSRPVDSKPAGMHVVDWDHQPDLACRGEQQLRCAPDARRYAVQAQQVRECRAP